MLHTNTLSSWPIQISFSIFIPLTRTSNKIVLRWFWLYTFCSCGWIISSLTTRSSHFQLLYYISRFYEKCLASKPAESAWTVATTYIIIYAYTTYTFSTPYSPGKRQFSAKVHALLESLLYAAVQNNI